MQDVLLDVKGVTIEATMKKGARAITSGVSFHLNKGEVLGIVGESGSGKSMTALSLIGLLPEGVKVVDGQILYGGVDVGKLSEDEVREIRGRDISMIFQEPMSSLNPVLKIGLQVEEALFLHGVEAKIERRERALAMLTEVGLEDVEELFHKYPHQLSGGMRQRVMIAIAMALKPQILIADEPTTALDVTVQEVILCLIKKMSEKYGTSVLFISHDLGVVKRVCQRALVMYGGKVVEQNEVGELFENPQSDYTRNLLHALPSKEKKRGRKREPKKELDEKESNGKVSLGQGLLEDGTRGECVLHVSELSVYYEERKKGFYGKKYWKQAVGDVSFDLYRGEILGLAGRSGIGKTSIARALTESTMIIEGKINNYGNKVRMVFQDPYGSLNPSKRVAWLLEEPLKIQGGYTKEERVRRVEEVLDQVGLDEDHLRRRVSGLSGGQRQRVAIACAIMCRPEIIILDEPVSALDVMVQDKVLALLVDIREKYDVSYLLISHDMAVLEQMCDRIHTL